MVTIEEAIETRIKQLVTGLQGKIFPVTAPKGTKAPYVVYSRVNTERYPTLESQGLYKPTFQFDIVANSYVEMLSLRMKVRLAFESQSGQFIAESPDIQNCNIINEDDGYDFESGKYTGILEIQYFYN